MKAYYVSNWEKLEPIKSHRLLPLTTFGYIWRLLLGAFLGVASLGAVIKYAELLYRNGFLN